MFLLDNNENADQRKIKIHFNQQKSFKQKKQGWSIIKYYGRELASAAAPEHTYPAMLAAKEIIIHLHAQTTSSADTVQTLGFQPHHHKASRSQLKNLRFRCQKQQAVTAEDQLLE